MHRVQYSRLFLHTSIATIDVFPGRLEELMAVDPALETSGGEHSRMVSSLPLPFECSYSLSPRSLGSCCTGHHVSTSLSAYFISHV